MANKKQNTKNNNDNSYGKQKRKNTSNAVGNTNNGSILDDRSKKDILAIALIIIGVALFSVSLIPTQAPVTSFIVNVLRFIFGVGIYIFPFVLAFIGISYFFRMERQKITIRVTIGLCLIFVAILTIISMCSQTIAMSRPEGLFDADTITNYGGIIGSAIAWLGYTLLGNTVTIILMVGIILAGLIVLGLSITNIVKRIKEKREDIERLNEDRAKAKGLHEQFANKDYIAKNPNANVPTNALFNNEGNVLVDSSGNVLTSNTKNPESLVTAAIDPSLIGPGGVYNKDANNMLKTTMAIDGNQGKKPGLKTRIFGWRNKNEEDRKFAYEPGQAQTKMLENSVLAKNNVDNIKTENQSQNEPNMTKKIPDPKDERKKQGVKKEPKRSISSVSDVSTPRPQEGFKLPDFSLLEQGDSSNEVVQSNSLLQQTADSLQKTLAEFNISANVVGWVAGPTVTLFKIDLPAGVRVSRITALNDDIALALAAPGVRVFAPIPGTTYVGIEVPNKTRQTVLLSEVLKKAKTGPLQISIGKDVEGNEIISDLAKMPHLLLGGTTGSGKSVSINAMIMSILMRATPSEVRLILIDPKRVEFTPFNGIPHLYVPVVTEPKEAASALSWGVAEMEKRLKVFSENGVRNIGGYNAKVQKMSDKQKEELGLEELPYIVIIIDELADLMMAVGKEVEYSISRIAQLARAAGIHLIVATQRPSTNVVTGLIKANITNRIAFNVASGIDSRVILDTGGAESLIGLGDMLFSIPSFSKPLRVQGCYVSESEISSVVEHLKKQAKPDYHNDILKTTLISVNDSNNGQSMAGSSETDDDLFWQAAEMIVSAQHGSTSSLQRRFKIGYARAGRIMDMLEEKGIVGPQNGSKPREVLVDSLELEGIKALEDYDNKKEDNKEKPQFDGGQLLEEEIE